MDADKAAYRTRALQMQELVHTPVWGAYTGCIRDMIEKEVERLLTGSQADFPHRAGYIQGLRDAIGLPLTIIRLDEQSRS